MRPPRRPARLRCALAVFAGALAAGCMRRAPPPSAAPQKVVAPTPAPAEPRKERAPSSPLGVGLSAGAAREVALGESAISRGEYARAKEHFRAAAEALGSEHPSPRVGDVLADWGLSELPHEYNRAPEDPRAEALRLRLDGVLKDAPQFGPAWLHRGRLLLVEGKTQAAGADLRRAAALLPDDAEVHSARGIVALASGSASGAVEHFERAVVLDPDNASRLSNLGAALTMDSRPQLALQQYRRAARLEPENPRIVGDLGTLLLALGRPQEALPSLTRAVRLAPERATFTSNLGYAWLSLGNHSEASRWLERAVRLDPGLGSAWLNLGILRAAQGDCAEARRAIERALQLDPADPRAIENLSELTELEAAECQARTP